MKMSIRNDSSFFNNMVLKKFNIKYSGLDFYICFWNGRNSCVSSIFFLNHRYGFLFYSISWLMCNIYCLEVNYLLFKLLQFIAATKEEIYSNCQTVERKKQIWIIYWMSQFKVVLIMSCYEFLLKVAFFIFAFSKYLIGTIFRNVLIEVNWLRETNSKKVNIPLFRGL